MDQCNNNLGPYRATKLWNDVVRSFRDGIPLKRHRRHVRVYENCFTGSEAVDWLHSYMKNNPNFGTNVTRNQSLQLLRKFVKNGLFEDTRGCKCVNADEFKDNGDLYRFNRKSPMKLNQTPKVLHCRKNNLLPVDYNQSSTANKSDEIIKNIQPKSMRKLSVQEIEDIWKSTVLKILQEKLALPDLEVILDITNMNSKHLIHNSTKLDKNGFVSVIDKNEDLPHWILSAMKCLLNWPNARGSGSCLPNYPGFELDVFGVVRDYFINLPTPLIPPNLYHVFIKVFLRAEYLDIDLKSSPCDDFHNFSPAQISSFPTFENLLQEASLKHSTPSTNLTPIPTDQISNINLPPHLYFETAFTSTEPVTRIIRHQPPFYLHPPKEIQTETETNLKLRRLHSHQGGYDNLGFLERNHSEIQQKNFPNQTESLSSYHTARSRIRGSSATTSSYHTASEGLKGCEDEESGKWMNKRRAVLEWVQKSCWPDLFSQSGRKNAIETFKLIGLFLQPIDRRKLHYLLVFMNSICKNSELRMINKKLVTLTFHQSILTSSDPLDQDDSVVLRLVNFLVESCDEIFKIPQDLIQQVNEKIKYQMENVAEVKEEEKILFTYCEQVSLAEYEKQRENHSKKALSDLFDNIMENNKMSEKEKKRKLRKFKESYPDIYSEKTNGETDKNKRKLNFLDRVRSLRI